MVKFGKFLRENLIEEWKENYFNYKKLKQLIKEFVNKEQKHKEIQTQSVNDTSDDRISSIKIDDDIREILQKDSFTYLKQFTTVLEEEIRKIYIFFTNCERDLYVKINYHLHQRNSYNYGDIAKELGDLVCVSSFTFLLCYYINLNMTAIKKILKKFDKKFNHIYGPVSIKILKEATDDQNKDLVYILQFKIIDELSALLEDLLNDLKLATKTTKVEPKYLKRESDDLEKKAPLVKKTPLIDQIYEKMIQLSNNLINIDESNSNYRATFKSWNTMVKDGNKVLYKHPSKIKDKHWSIITLDEEPLANKMMSYNKYNTDTLKLSQTNSMNLILILVHTLFYMINYLIILPTNGLLLSQIFVEPIFSGIVLAFTPIFAIFSTLLFSKWSNISYKEAFIFSVLSLMAGNFVYASSLYFNSFSMVCIGRAFVGLGSGRILNRRYLLQFLPKNYLNKYGCLYSWTSSIGTALGPIIAYPLLFFNYEIHIFEYFIVNQLTFPCWFCFFFSVIFSLVSFFAFTDPKQPSFRITEQDKSFDEFT